MTDKLVVAVTDKLCFTEIDFRFYPKMINWQGTFGTASGSAPSRTKARGRKPPCELFCPFTGCLEKPPLPENAGNQLPKPSKACLCSNPSQRQDFSCVLKPGQYSELHTGVGLKSEYY